MTYIVLIINLLDKTKSIAMEISTLIQNKKAAILL